MQKETLLPLIIAVIFIGLGALLLKNKWFSSQKVEILETQEASQELIVEIGGSVNKPGVYTLPGGSRVEDAINAAEGLTDDANTDWTEKYLNRAAKATDGQKIYIPSNSESSETSLVNINTSTQKELESLSGIGPVTAQNIIEGRPYSSVEELLGKKVLKQNVYDRNKDTLSVY